MAAEASNRGVVGEALVSRRKKMDSEEKSTRVLFWQDLQGKAPGYIPLWHFEMRCRQVQALIPNMGTLSRKTLGNLVEVDGGLRSSVVGSRGFVTYSQEVQLLCISGRVQNGHSEAFIRNRRENFAKRYTVFIGTTAFHDTKKRNALTSPRS